MLRAAKWVTLSSIAGQDLVRQVPWVFRKSSVTPAAYSALYPSSFRFFKRWGGGQGEEGEEDAAITFQKLLTLEFRLNLRSSKVQKNLFVIGEVGLQLADSVELPVELGGGSPKLGVVYNLLLFSQGPLEELVHPVYVVLEGSHHRVYSLLLQHNLQEGGE